MYNSIKCKIHNTPIGGVCSDMNCINSHQLLCMQCISSPTSCIRAKNHKFIPIGEFADNFDKEFLTIKSNSTVSQSVNTVIEICANCEKLVENYHQENEKIGTSMINIFQSFIDELNKKFVEFNNNHIKHIQEKEEELREALSNLLTKTSYDLLCSFNSSQLKEKIESISSHDELSQAILAMKTSLLNLRSDELTRNALKVKEITTINSDKVIQYFTDEFKALSQEATKRYHLYENTLKENLFAGNQSSKNSLGEYELIYDDTIDFTANANFTAKKFTVFEHSNGNTLIAYPTSQNTIKLEYLDKILSAPEPIIKPNSNIYVTAKANARDKFLYFTLASHSAKINDIVYYRTATNCDYLISSSDDTAIKIWNITKLHLYLSNVNEYYKTNCIKTLLGHQGAIVAMKVFFDPTRSINYIVSLGYNDKIKVWDLVKAQFIRDISDSNLNRGSYDNTMTIANANKKNVLITANSMRRLVKIYDFDSGEVMRVLNYEGNSKIINVEFFEDMNSVVIIDDCGECGIMEFKGDVSKAFLRSAKIEKCGPNEARLGSFRWDKEKIGFYGKGGIITLVELKTGKVIDKKVLAKSYISCALAYMHHTKQRIILLHSGDMHLKIFN